MTTSLIRPQELADRAIELVKHWLAESEKYPADPSAKRLAEVLEDPNGLEFTVGFVDGVVRPKDYRSAAKKLRELAPLAPKFLPAPLRGAMTTGAAMSKLVPGVVVPAARRVLREMVSHLIIDASDEKLGKAIAKIKTAGVRLNVNLLGEYILGQQEADRRLEGTRKLLARDDVDYVSIKVSSTVAMHTHWDFDEAVEDIVARLVPLYGLAARSSAPKFINLDMEEYKDLNLTIAVFKKILERAEFYSLSAGIVLQAYLPDALGATMDLQDWAAHRVASGGAPIKIRVVKGANLPMERVEAAINSWPLATWGSKQATDTSYKAVLDFALRPEHVKNVRVGVAGHNLFDLALAWLLATERGAAEGMDVEMLLGMASGQAEAVKKDVGNLLLYTPVVHPEEFDVAIAYLVRRLEEGASTENFMSAIFDLGTEEELFEREKQRFLASLAELKKITGDGDPAHFNVPVPSRSQDRRVLASEKQIGQRVDEKVEAGRRGEFTNVANSDPNLPGNQQWAREIAARMTTSELGKDAVSRAQVLDAGALDQIIERGARANAPWQALGADERARILYRADERLEAKRAELIEVAGAECGKTIDQTDPEISEAIDFANYYAMLGQALVATDGATPVPEKLIAVIPPWNFPVAIPAGGVLAGLAAGSSVIIKPASAAARTGAIMVEALWEAGVPRDVLQFVQFSDRELGSALVSDPRVGRVILTGSYETAEHFRSLREDMPLLGETSGKNAIIVMPDADLDLAAHDVVQSAFGHAGQKCSASSLVVLVGSVATSGRFRSQLLDAVQSLKVGTPDDLGTQMGPVTSPPSGKLLRGLTTLGPGERWLVKPEPINSSNPISQGPDGMTRLWSPGVRDGVKPGSEYHQVEYFGPILGIMTAKDLTEAIQLVNDIDYGLTSGIHSLDAENIAQWLETVQAGNLYVNRGITGAMVRRQPFGGWKKSAIGAGTKVGAPSYLHGLVNWEDAASDHAGHAALPQVMELLGAYTVAEGTSQQSLDWLRLAAASDAAAWNEEFGTAEDVSQVGVERNILRYLPTKTFVRATEDSGLHHVVRVLAAGLAAGASPWLSTAVELPAEITQALKNSGVTVRVESDRKWLTAVKNIAERTGPDSDARIRVVAGDSHAEQVREIYRATKGKPDIAVYGGPVVTAGRVEMLPHLKEQALSMTAHRFGTPNHLTAGII